jgi:hypothetical protein
LSLRFQADADLEPDIGRGLRLREPSVDFRSATGVIPDGTPDPEVLRIAAEEGRILVSGDVNTMCVHFERFIHRAARFSRAALDSFEQINRRRHRGCAHGLADLVA